MSIESKQGDKYTFRFTLRNKKKSAIDLTGYNAVLLKLQPYLTGSSAVTYSCTVIDADNGIVDFNMEGLVEGRYVAEFEVQYSNGEIRSSKDILWVVKKDLPKSL